jgi:hypothetical protein
MKNLIIEAVPSAFDVSQTNTGVVWVGFQGSIWRTDDGAITWNVKTTSKGAVDIVCDPQLAGVAYFRTPDGELYYLTDTVLSAQMLDVTESDTPTRVIRSINSGRFYAMDSNTLKVREYGAWTSLGWTATSCRGLRAYLGTSGDSIVYMATKPYFSLNGATASDKSGTGAAFGAASKTIHLLEV